MKKILLLGVTLLSVLFLTFNYSSCKKKETTPTPTSLVGTKWVYQVSQAGISGKIELSFAISGNNATLIVSALGVQTGGLDATYTYSNGQGTLTDTEDTTTTYPFTVSGNNLTLDLGEVTNGPKIFTQQ